MKVTVSLRLGQGTPKIFHTHSGQEFYRDLAQIYAKECYQSGMNFDTFHVRVRDDRKVHEYEIRARQPAPVFEAVA